MKSKLKTYGVINFTEDGRYVVKVFWKSDIPLDRPSTFSMSCGKSSTLAYRYELALSDQVVFYDSKIVKDCFGKTFVDAKDRVSGRYLSADLKKLGY